MARTYDVCYNFSTHCCPSCLLPVPLWRILPTVPGIDVRAFLTPLFFHPVITWHPAPHGDNDRWLLVTFQGEALVAAAKSGDVGAVATLANASTIEHNEVPPPQTQPTILFCDRQLTPGPPTHVLAPIPSRCFVPIPPPPSVSPLSLSRAWHPLGSRLASPAAVLCARALLVGPRGCACRRTAPRWCGPQPTPKRRWRGCCWTAARAWMPPTMCVAASRHVLRGT